MVCLPRSFILDTSLYIYIYCSYMFLLAFNQDLKVQTFLLPHVSTSVGMTINVGVCGGRFELITQLH